jgi:hypothetical protein
MAQFFKNQRGQTTVGFYIALMAMLIFLYVGVKEYGRVRSESFKSKYKELALDIARSGFENTHAWFLSNGTVGALYPLTPTSYAQGWPDDMFQPGITDTDFFNAISFPSATGTMVGKGVVRDYPLNVSFAVSSYELASPRIWGRYVVRRQIYRNWVPPGTTMSTSAAADFYGNTHNIVSDPDAAHDLTSLRSGSGVSITSNDGGGAIWGINVRSYIYAAPAPLSDTSLFENGDLLGKPLAKYPSPYPACLTLSGKTLLLASAKAYGEIAQLAMNISDSVPVQIFLGSNLNVINNATVGQSSGFAVLRTDSSKSVTTGGATLNPSANPYNSWSSAVGTNTNPSLASVFPGTSLNDLAALADYVGPVTIFPAYNINTNTPAGLAYAAATSTMTFYLIQGNAVFDSAKTRVLQGIGLVVVNGNLTIQDGNPSSWAGIVYVNGNVLINSGGISGCLIATGTVTVKGGTLLNSYVQANKDVADQVMAYLKQYRVKKSTVQTN